MSTHPPRLAVTAPFGFTFDIVRLLRAYKALGVTHAQFYRNEKNPPTVEQALEASRASGVAFDSIHGVFGEHIDPTSPDASERARCVEIYTREGELCRALGGEMVVVHPACFFPGMKMVSVQEAHAQAQPRWPRLAGFMGELAKIGERQRMIFLIENQPRNCPLGHEPEKLAQAVLAAGSPWVRMCFDTGHAHMTGDMIAALRACAPAISYLHVHDNDSNVDDHRMCGDGTIDWNEFARALREMNLGATRMLETFNSEEALEKMAQAGFGARLRDMLAV